MGADLYINPLFQPHHAKWEKRFNRAAALRDRLERGTEAYERAQKRDEYCFEPMMERGYFRDPYNQNAFLWQPVPRCPEGRAASSNAQGARIRALLVDGRHSDARRRPVFEQNLRALTAPDVRYFRKRYRAFQTFLGQAIRLNAPVECSL